MFPAVWLLCGIAVSLLPNHVQAASISKVWTRLDVSRRGFLSRASPTSSSPSGRHSMAYLVAMQEWRRVTRKGVDCPPPQPCQCHCDCPETVAEKPPPPPEPCPIYPGFPTTPAPEPLPTTAAPRSLDSVNVPGFEKPITFSTSCAHGEVMYSDGMCKKVTVKMIEELIKLCHGLKASLDHLEQKAKAGPPAEYVFLKFDLMRANDRYRRALDLLLSLLGNFAGEQDAEQVATVADSDGNQSTLEPEFVYGQRVHRTHCEPWSKNATTYTKGPGSASPNTCGIICRNEPTCVGFSIDPAYGWCVWYDDEVEPPFVNEQCSGQNKTTYIKNREGKYNATIWIAIEKVHAYERKWHGLLRLAAVQSEIANSSFFTFWSETNATLKNETLQTLYEAKDNYTKTMAEAESIKSLYFYESNSTYWLIRSENEQNPPFPDAAKNLPANPNDSKPQGVSLPLQALAQDLKPSPTPVPLRWEDFPNSQDTPWSKRHPECPMGPACWCDCSCRGAPPQNFVANPPPPVQPCPPPPLPPNPLAVTPVFAR